MVAIPGTPAIEPGLGTDLLAEVPKSHDLAQVPVYDSGKLVTVGFRQITLYIYNCKWVDIYDI